MILNIQTIPIQTQAIQYSGSNFEAIRNFAEKINYYIGPKSDIEIYDRIQNDWVKCNVGDYVVRGVFGEYYVCTPVIFQGYYQVMDVQVEGV